MSQGIVVSLVFDSEHTRELGIDGHVCELQLVTRDFADIVQVDCAARPRATRNERRIAVFASNTWYHVRGQAANDAL